MAIREGFDFSGVRRVDVGVEEERKVSDNPLSGVRKLGAPAAQEDVQVTPGYEDRPKMSVYDAPWHEDVVDWLKGTKDHLAHGESFSMMHNAWKDLFNPHEAVPVRNEQGELTGTRQETDEERRQRIVMNKRVAQKVYGLDPESSEAMAAKVTSIFLDPATYTVPMGKTYLAAAGLGGTVAGVDAMAYGLANEGQIDPQDVGIAVAFGTVLGPVAKVIVDKAIPAYKALRGSGKSHEEALQETMKALPAPEERKLLPAPEGLPAPKAQARLPAPEKLKALPSPGKTTAPQYVDELGRPTGTRGTSDRGLTEVTERIAKSEEDAFEGVANHMRQGGGISETLMHHMAASGLGAAIGGGIDGPEGAVYGGLAGMGAPTMWKHVIKKPIGKLNEWSKTDAAGAFAQGKFMSSPTATLKRAGPEGRKLAEKMERLHENIDMAVGGKVHQFDKRFGNLSTEQMDTVRGLLDHTVSPSAASKAERAAATLMRREMNEVLDDAVNAGIMTRKKAEALKVRARTHGYFPRQYNTALLSTKAGKQAWVKAWTEFTGSKKDMEQALLSIIGDKDIVTSIMAKSGGKMTRGQALDVLRIMRNRNSAKRSAHLETQRTINESAEKILRPFLEKDPRAAMLHYFDDVYRRIEASKEFGGQMLPKSKKGLPYWNTDKQAEELITSIHAKDSTIGNMAEDLFYTSVGDQKSSIVQAYTRLGDLEGRVMRGLGGFETGAKLGLAQVANVFQATVNGMSRLLKVSANPVTSMRLYTKGLVRALGKDGRDFSNRVGAALETTLMEVAGEASNMGKFGEKTLKYTGFIAAEKAQRILGSNIGRAYAEELTENYVKIQQGAIKGRRAQKILKQMDELGLPTTRPVTQVDIDRAGLRFSNEINFRNTPDKLPMAWQTPYGKVLTKFKSFAFHQGRFVKNNVLKPLLRGNPWPALWYTAPSAGIGMGIDEFRRMVKGDDRELTMVERYLRGLTMIGGMGIMQDTLQSLYRSPESGIASVAGPAAGDIAKVGGGVVRAAVDQDPNKILEAVSRVFVFPGHKAIVDEISAEGKKRGRSSGRAAGRGGSRGGSR